MRQESFSIHVDYGNFTKVLLIQSRLGIRRKFLSVHREYMLKLIWEIGQEYFALHGEYAGGHKIEPIATNFLQKPLKFQISNHLPRHDRIGKKNISRYCPLTDLFGLL
jgi:hypothetical protein